MKRFVLSAFLIAVLVASVAWTAEPLIKHNVLPITKGGTGARTAAGARTELGISSSVEVTAEIAADNATDAALIASEILADNATDAALIASEILADNATDAAAIDAAILADNASDALLFAPLPLQASDTTIGTTTAYTVTTGSVITIKDGLIVDITGP